MSDALKNQEIVPVTQSTTIVINSFKVEIIRLVLFRSAFLRVLMYDVYDHQINVTCLELQGEDYLKWSTNDEYIYEFVAKQLGFVLVR